MEILIVDDSRVITDIFEQFLDRRGYKVHSARSGTEALAQVASYPGINLILMDLHMPGIDGRETGIEIKKRQPAIAIYAISARSRGDVWPQLKEAGFAGYLEKPLKLSEIESLLSCHFGTNKTG